MKKLLIYTLFLFIIASIYFLYDQQSTSLPPVSPSPSPVSTPSILDQLDTITYNHQTFHYSLVTIDQLDNLSLLPNYDLQIPSQDLINTHNCKVLVNAGFYDKQNQPLGWLVSNGQTISSPIKSSLFNGFLYLSSQKPAITSDLPTDSVDFGLQSGPLLMQNSKTLPLNINNDQPRRRVIAALSGNNQLIFIVLVSEDSLLSGPLLADTPAIISNLSQKLEINLTSAINLDGGSASSFFTPDLHLKEYSPIGSFFCLN